MGFRVARIGKTISWTPLVIRRYPMISLVVLIFVSAIISKICFGEDVPAWYNIIYFIVSGVIYDAVDKQLPHKKYRSMALFLGGFFLFFGGIVINELVVKNNTAFLDTVDCAIIAILLLISLGYCLYSAWRWRRQIILCNDILLGRELRAKRRKSHMVGL